MQRLDDDSSTIRIGRICPTCLTPTGAADAICPTHGLYPVPPIEAQNLKRAPLLGQVIDARYALIGHVGAGGMGAVYRALQLRIGREVALKLLRGGVESSDLHRARFEQEAQVIATLESDYTVRVYDFGEVESGPLAGTLYMVMDLVEGFSLSERLQAGPLLLEEVGLVLDHVANSVDEAHSKGIVHRDLKPSNILLTEHQGQRRAKVIDFGIARMDEGQHTRDGGVLGTPGYMAPEQWSQDSRRVIDGRTDVYAMGVVIYHLLTGRKPFPQRSILTLAAAHCGQAPPPLAPPGDPIADFEPVVFRAMAKAPAARYPTMGAFAADFRRQLQATIARHGASRSFTWAHAAVPPASLEPTLSSQIPRGAIEPVARPVAPTTTSRWWPVATLVAMGLALATLLMQTGVVATGAGQAEQPEQPVVGEPGRSTAATGALAAAVGIPDPRPPPPQPEAIGPDGGPGHGSGSDPEADRSASSGAGEAPSGASARGDDEPPEPDAGPGPSTKPTPQKKPPKKRPRPRETKGQIAARKVHAALSKCECVRAKHEFRAFDRAEVRLPENELRALRRRVTGCRRPELGQPCEGQ